MSKFLYAHAAGAEWDGFVPDSRRRNRHTVARFCSPAGCADHRGDRALDDRQKRTRPRGAHPLGSTHRGRGGRLDRATSRALRSVAWRNARCCTVRHSPRPKTSKAARPIRRAMAQIVVTRALYVVGERARSRRTTHADLPDRQRRTSTVMTSRPGNCCAPPCAACAISASSMATRPARAKADAVLLSARPRFSSSPLTGWSTAACLLAAQADSAQHCDPRRA